MRKGTLVAKELVSSLAATDGQLALRICRPHGPRDLPCGLLGQLRLHLEESGLGAKDEETVLVQRPNEAGDRFILLEFVIDRSIPPGMVLNRSRAIIQRCYELAELDASRQRRAVPTAAAVAA